jgi:putative sterol carrier protein
MKNMTYEQVVAKVRSKFENANASKIDGVVALQINLEGKTTNGIFYIEVKDHKVNVEPYDYYDHNAIVTVNQTNLFKILDGKLDPKTAFESGKVLVDGDAKAVLTVFKLAK